MLPKKLDDDSLMPYGKYKGVRMSHIPKNYLRYLMEQNRFIGNDGRAVKDYIYRNVEVICPDRTPE